MTAKVRDLVVRSTEYLERHGIESPRLDSELLIAHALGYDRVKLYVNFDEPLGEDEIANARGLVVRRKEGEPVAYIVGKKEFFGLPFTVTRDVLIPRPETELLVSLALEGTDRKAELSLLDCCTGCGCIGLSLLHELENSRLVATDVSDAALAVAQENAGALGLSSRVSFRSGSYGTVLIDTDSFDIVVSNPPYLRTADIPSLAQEVLREPLLALDGGKDGCDAYRAILPSLAGRVRTGARCVFEIDPGYETVISELVTASFPHAIMTTKQDLSGLVRAVDIRLDAPE